MFGGAKAHATMEVTNGNVYSNGIATMIDREAFMDILACAAKVDQTTLAELVKTNAALVSTNKKLVSGLQKVNGTNRSIQKRLVNLSKVAGVPVPTLVDGITRASAKPAGHGGLSGCGRHGAYVN